MYVYVAIKSYFPALLAIVFNQRHITVLKGPSFYGLVDFKHMPIYYLTLITSRTLILFSPNLIYNCEFKIY